jgi:hypothetical protein
MTEAVGRGESFMAAGERERARGPTGFREQVKIREPVLIENNILRHKQSTTRRQTSIPFVRWRITKKYTLMRPKFKFVSVIRSQQRKTCTTKNFEKLIIRMLIKQRRIWCLKIDRG